MERVAALAVELGFDGVDINMGCPDKSVERQGAGAALMKNPKLARELIAAAKRGTQNKIPVSVKTRLGYNEDELETWLPELLAKNPAAIIIHARTRKEMSKVPARWGRIKDAVVLRDEIQATHPQPFPKGRVSGNPFPSARGRGEVKTLILGNGDIENVRDARRIAEETGADGVMLGRAIFGNPFLFSNHTPTVKQKLEALIEHTRLFEQKLGGTKIFAVMKKHFKSYLSGIPNSKEFLSQLMLAENSLEVHNIINHYGLS